MVDRYKIDTISGLSLKRHINEHAKEYNLTQVVPYIERGIPHYYIVIMEKRDWHDICNYRLEGAP